jgi:hypothetical protein
MSIDDLDISWVETHDKIEKLDAHSLREPMKVLDCHFIFMDGDMAITKIVSEKEVLQVLLDPNNSSAKINRGIHKDRLLEMVQSKRIHDDKKYKLIHWMQFHVGLEPENTQAFLEKDDLDPSDFVKTPSYLVDLVVEDSIFIFHDVNCLFFFFKEADSKKRYNGKTMKQLLLEKEKRITKKVRF